ncbi:MAG TPA: HAD-IIB family hydrolase [Myxococcaceae bacterium]|nr:HAD-IIB family hydrolase [Myxococcaceae bacterium]
MNPTTTLPAPLASADLSRVQAVFADVDGTLTTEAVLESSTVRALELLRDAGLRVVLVSGRPAGWAECWARSLPVEGVIAENGALYFAHLPEGGLKKVYAQRPSDRRKIRARLWREVRRAIRQVPGARLSQDSLYTEVDLAIDYNEEVQLGSAAADRLEEVLRERGVRAVRSNVHVNCWIGGFDKLTTVERYMQRQWRVRLKPGDLRFVYVGDSFNDATLFEAFQLSVGVANVRDVLNRIPAAPAFITREREGRGFRELVRELLVQRRRIRSTGRWRRPSRR